MRPMLRVFQFFLSIERYWHRMLCSRSWDGLFTWAVFHQLRDRFPLQQPRIYCLTGSSRLMLCCEATYEERSAGNPHATVCGSRAWFVTPGDPVALSNERPRYPPGQPV
jgi:hypothetical protein